MCEPHDSTGEPGAGNRPAGFGERGEETCPWESDCGPAAKALDEPPNPTGYAPPLDSTTVAIVTPTGNTQHFVIRISGAQFISLSENVFLDTANDSCIIENVSRLWIAPQDDRFRPIVGAFGPSLTPGTQSSLDFREPGVDPGLRPLVHFAATGYLGVTACLTCLLDWCKPVRNDLGGIIQEDKKWKIIPLYPWTPGSGSVVNAAGSSSLSGRGVFSGTGFC